MYKDKTVSKFDNYQTSSSNETVNIWNWLLVEHPIYTPRVMEIRSTTDPIRKKQLKSLLPAITISGIFSKRESSKIIEHSGLICIDIDKKENPILIDLELVKKELAKKTYILYCGISVGGEGLFCVIPIAFTDKHKQHFNALEKEFLEIGIIVDKQCSDVSRLRGYSYDYEPNINWNATVYGSTLEKSTETPIIKHRESNSNFKFESAVQTNVEPKKLSNDELMASMLKSSINNNVKVLLTTKSSDIRGLFASVIESKIDITDNCKDWFDICCYLAKNFEPNEGRDLFQAISQFYPNYKQDECDDKFNECLRNKYYPSYGTISEIAKKYGFNC